MRLAAAAAFVLVTFPAPAASSDLPYADLIRAAAARHRIDPDLLAAVVAVESGFRPDAVSPVGAQGLMQLMPGTQSDLGVADPFDPAVSLDAGARYLRSLADEFGTVLALAAYNAGPGAVRRYRGVPPYPETRRYLRLVLVTLFSIRAGIDPF